MPLPGNPDGIGWSHLSGTTSVSAGAKAGTSAAVNRLNWAIKGVAKDVSALVAYWPNAAKHIAKNATIAAPMAAGGSFL
jgi:hypothetical protein